MSPFYYYYYCYFRYYAANNCFFVIILQVIVSKIWSTIYIHIYDFYFHRKFYSNIFFCSHFCYISIRSYIAKKERKNEWKSFITKSIYTNKITIMMIICVIYDLPNRFIAQYLYRSTTHTLVKPTIFQTFWKQKNLFPFFSHHLYRRVSHETLLIEF